MANKDQTTDFKNQTFYYCYDCGWGERGVHEYDISFAQAREIIADRASEETAAKWEADADGYYEFRPDYYMISKAAFVEEHWEGSEDW